MKKGTEHDRYVRGIWERMLFNIIAGIAIVAVICSLELLAGCEVEPTEPTEKTHNGTTEQGGGGGLVPENVPWHDGMNGETTAEPVPPEEEEHKDNAENTENNNATKELEEKQDNGLDNDTTANDNSGVIINPTA